METVTLLATALALAAPAAVPAPAPDQEATAAAEPAHAFPAYLTIGVGVVAPQSTALGLAMPSASRAGYDPGFAFEAAIGYRVNAHLSLELGAGRFVVESSATGAIDGNVPGIATLVTIDGTRRVVAYPVMATVKAVATLGRTALFALVGGGVCFLSAETEVHGRATPYLDPNRSFSDHDDSAALQVGAGFEVPIARHVGLGFALKYLTQEAKLFGVAGRFDTVMFLATVALSP